MASLQKNFLGDDFLLENDIAVDLYEKFAAPLPIVDYHNHLSARDIAENRKFASLTEAWLDGDHYKWRAMRANGIEERFCTGAATAKEKFMAWATTVPYTLRNPLYHWAHLELKNYFGIAELLDQASAQRIFESAGQMLLRDDYRVRGLLEKMNVEVVCTTDDPADSLEHHEKLASTGGTLQMFPTFRPDKVYSFDEVDSFNAYLNKLGAVARTEIATLNELVAVLKTRISDFDNAGCRSADHGIDSLYFDPKCLTEAPVLFSKIRGGAELNRKEKLKLRCAILFQLCQLYHEKGWIQQFHLGALRGNNSRMLHQLGPDSGFDSIGDLPQAQHLSRFLNALDLEQTLCKTILYNIHPSNNEVFATMAGNFNDGSVPGKIQFGAAWWFLDQKDGIEKQINVLSNMGLLSRFVGMVTDSRSFLSFPRHEYFRRILCNMIGKDIANGEIPNEPALVGPMIQNICYYNSKNYFRFRI